MTRTPPRDDTETITCPVCRHPFTPTGRQRYFTSACRKTAYRRRHHDQPGPVTVPPARTAASTPSINAPNASSASSASRAAPTAPPSPAVSAPAGPARTAQKRSP